MIVALDVPSGLDATTGESAAGMVSAHVTLMYGTVKRGALLSRAVCGRLLLLDIGLHEHACTADEDGAWTMLNTHELSARLPSIEWNAYKGQRGHVAIVGGASGMAGAAVRAVFIRAPAVESVGPGVTVIGRVAAVTHADASRHVGRIVAVRQGNLLATAFHPELTGDTRVHRLLVDLASGINSGHGDEEQR